MPTPAKGSRLGGSPAHERLMLGNLATALFEHKKITTTEHRAKRLQPVAEKLITLAKRGDLHARRKVMTTVRRKDVVAELFEQTAPKFAERNGGYTRITKVAPRKGDNAPMAVIELVLEAVSPKQATVREAEKAAARAAKAEPKAETAAEDATVTETSSEETSTEATEAKQYAGAVRLAEGSTEAPDAEHTIKGNEDSMKYHVPGSRWYDGTNAEVWFATAEEAEAAGFEPAGGADAQDVTEEA